MGVIQEKTIYHNSSLGVDEVRQREIRVEELHEILSHVRKVAALTTKEEKLLTYAEMIRHFTGQIIVVGQHIVPHSDRNFVEPAHHDPVEVARTKVHQVKGLTLEEMERMDFPEDLAAVAGDLVAYVEGKNEELVISHQLSRLNRPLTHEEAGMVRLELIRRYHDVPEAKGFGRIMYESGTYIQNGTSMGLGDKMEITFTAVDKELLDIYFIRAIENGLVYCSNMQMEAIECLIESGAIKSVAILPRELEEKGYTVEDLRRAPTPDLLNRVREAVVTNIPPHNY